MRALLDAGWRGANNFRTQLYDARAGYGWLSIRLHWAAAIAVIMLWFIGNQMTAANTSADEYGILVRVHTSVAVTIYALLLYRVFRRLHIGFPGRSADQTRPLFRLARVVHYALLFCILMMLFSGPLAVWSGGDAIGFFGFSKIASPFGADESCTSCWKRRTERSRRYYSLCFGSRCGRVQADPSLARRDIEQDDCCDGGRAGVRISRRPLLQR